jgi:hypothetical protein
MQFYTNRGRKGRKSLASLAALAAKNSSVAWGDGVQYRAVDKSSNGGGALIVVGAQSIVLATRKLQQQKESNLIEPSSIQRSSKQDSGARTYTTVDPEPISWSIKALYPRIRPQDDRSGCRPDGGRRSDAAADVTRAMNTTCVGLL